ncbi:MAG: hypothetical protein HQK51_13150, partial [Oligoflexia bacterium]|nr:hypothetical protein [Oligoflexia bacterium]
LGFKSFVNKLSSLLPTSSTPSANIEQNKNNNETSTHDKIITNTDDIQLLMSDIEKSCNLAYYIEYLPSQELFNEQPMFVAINLDGLKFYHLDSISFPELSQNLLSYLFFDETRVNKQQLLIGADIKIDALYILSKNLKFNVKYFDVLKAHYLIDVTTKHNLNFISSKYLHKDLLTIGKKELPLKERPLEFKVEYAKERVQAIYELFIIFKKKLNELNLEKIFYEIDNPLSLV